MSHAVAPASAGVILAGGQGRRMGGAKAGRLLGGQPLVAHVIARLRPQVVPLLLSGRPDDSALTPYGLPVIADPVAERLGPLAGVLAAMDWLTAHAPHCRWLLSAPVDVPFLPADLARRLFAAVVNGPAEIACAGSNGRSHPVIALYPLSLRNALARTVLVDRQSRVSGWQARHGIAVVDWPDDTDGDPFVNINAPDDLIRAESRAAAVMCDHLLPPGL